MSRDRRLTGQWCACKVFLLAIALGIACTGASSSAGVTYTGEGDLADFAIELRDSTAILFLAQIDSNEPLHGAKVVLQENGKSVAFTASERDGVYSARVEGLTLAGKLTVELEGKSEVIDIESEASDTQASLGTATAPQPSEGDASTAKIKPFLWGGFTGALLILLLLGLGRVIHSRRGGAAAALLLAALGGIDAPYSQPAFAHEGHDEAPDPSAGAAAGADVKMSKRSQFLMGVRTILAKEEELGEVVVCYGHVIPKPELNITVTAPQSGYYHLHGLTLGMRVQRHESLSGIDALSHIHIRSPIEGEILEIHTVEGTRVDAGAPLFRVTNTSTVWMDAEVFAQDLAKIKRAGAVTVAIDGLDKALAAKVIGVPTFISEETRTAKVFLEIDNTDGEITLGSLASAHFALKELTKGIPVPSSAVLNRGGDLVAFTKYGPETFELRQVITKHSSRPGTVLVVYGLADGDRVVIAGNYQLLMKAK